jgi:hypothetical protein
LFNVATVCTVVIGVLALYVALLVLTLIGTVLLPPHGVLAEARGHPLGLADQVEFALVGQFICDHLRRLGRSARIR